MRVYKLMLMLMLMLMLSAYLPGIEGSRMIRNQQFLRQLLSLAISAR